MDTHGSRHRSTVRTRDPRTRHDRHGARAAGARSVRPAELAVFIAIALAIAAVSCLPTPADGATGPTVTRAVRVEASDTLWSIAERHASPGTSTADMVATLRRANGMGPDDTLQPGTFVKVPCPDDGEFALARR